MTETRPTLVHLKNSGYTDSAPVAPQSGVLKKGEIAVNYNSTEPSLFIEKANGEVARFADLSYIDNHYLKEESDPIFTGSPAYTITSAQIENWDSMAASGKVEYHAGENIAISDDNIISVTGLPTEFKTINGTAVTGTGAITIDIPDVSNFVTSAEVETQIEDAISGLPKEFKTINGTAITGNGDINITEYTGITSEDVVEALGFTPISANTVYTAGDNINIENDVISVTGLPNFNDYALTADLATVATTNDYNDLDNRPTIPTVNNAVLTVVQDGVTAGTFDANASADTTITITTSNKADKDIDAIEGNIAVFNASGDPVDGGVSFEYVAVKDGTYEEMTVGAAEVASTALTLNGKTEADFAPSSHTHSEYVNQNAFGSVSDGTNTYVATSTTDTLSVSGEGITSVEVNNGKVVVSTPTFPAYEITDAQIENWDSMVASGKVEYHAGQNIEITNDNIINVTGVTSYTGINSSEVIEALGYTPYDASNPSGFVTTDTTYTAGDNIAIDGNNVISVTGMPDVSDFVTSADVETQIINKHYITSGDAETQIISAISGIPTNFATINNSAITNGGNLTINEYSGITGEEVITALGFTPYDNTNPSGFVTTDTTYEAGTNIAITGNNNTISVVGIDIPDVSEFITSGDVKTQIEGYHFLTEHQSLAGLFKSVEYVSSAKTIYFYDSADTQVGTIDTTDFIKDGMVSNVVISGGNLVISFNTDAGKEDIEIPISDIFDASNYYTKSEVDNTITAATENMATTGWVDSQGYLKEHQSLSAYSTTEQMNTAIENATSGKADSTAVTEAINTAIAAETARTESTYLKEHQSLSAYSTTEQMNVAIESAVSGKQDTLVSGTNIKTINNQSLLGEGNLTIEGALYTGGNNISIDENNVIAVTGIPTEFKTVNGSAVTGSGAITIDIPDVSEFVTSADVETQIINKNYITSGDAETQINNAISGIPKEFKTINNSAVTGTGNITISEYCGITSTDVTNALGYTPYDATNPSGFVSTDTTYTAGNNIAITGDNNTISVTGINSYTGINSTEVITALGYTPYDSTNPEGYVTSDTTYSAGQNIAINDNNVISVIGIVNTDSATTYTGHYTPYNDDVTNVNGFVNALSFDGKGHIISYGTGLIPDSATTQEGHYAPATPYVTAETNTAGTLNYGSSFTIPTIAFDNKGHEVSIGSKSITLPNEAHYTNPLVFQDASNNIISFNQATAKTITVSGLTDNVNVSVDSTNGVIGFGVSAPSSAETAGKTVSALTINYRNGDGATGTTSFNGSADTTVGINSLMVSSVTAFTSSMTDPSVVYAVSGSSRRGVNMLTGYTANTITIPVDKDFVYVKFASNAATDIALDVNSGLTEGEMVHVVFNASTVGEIIQIGLNLGSWDIEAYYSSDTQTLNIQPYNIAKLDILCVDGVYFICKNEYPAQEQSE